MFRRSIFLLLLIAAPLRAQRVTLSARLGDRLVQLDTATRLWPLLSWQRQQPGLDVSDVALRAGALGLNVHAIIARIDPRQFDLQLILRTRANGMTGTWTVDSVSSDVAFAFNAGQFKETGPWGWLVMNSYEERAPGYGPLSAAIAIDTAGGLQWLLPRDVAKRRSDRSIRYAFQSYPLLIFDGHVPAALRSSTAISRTHRDARLILAQRKDGMLLVILTRYEGLGEMAARVPIGLTVPESVVVAASLGARYALMLDGGISAQLLVRDEAGDAMSWKGFRSVPLALAGHARSR